MSLRVCPSDADLEDMIENSDLDGNGTISFDEFVELMQHRMGNMMKSTNELGED